MKTAAKQDRRSPRIARISWGRMEVEGVGAGKDFKLYPGGGRAWDWAATGTRHSPGIQRAWDWAETGTRHSPGIQRANVEELVAHGATTVVLSRGMNSQLQVHPDTCRSAAAMSASKQAKLRFPCGMPSRPCAWPGRSSTMMPWPSRTGPSPRLRSSGAG